MNAGRVNEVDTISTLPREVKPAQRIRVEVQGSHDVVFWIATGVAPAVGDTIAWGAHHATWGGVTVRKLTDAWNPDDPHLYTG